MAYTSADFPNLSSAQAKRTADQVNSMHPTVSDRFAKSIQEFNADPDNIAAGNTAAITEGFRSNARSDELNASGIQAASGGNSWHNYAAAGDVIVLQDGKWDQNNDSGLYTSKLTEKFEANGLTNPYKNNDSGHFQPTEFTNAVPTEIKNGQQTVSDLLGVPEPDEFDAHLPDAKDKITVDEKPDATVIPEDEKAEEMTFLLDPFQHFFGWVIAAKNINPTCCWVQMCTILMMKMVCLLNIVIHRLHLVQVLDQKSQKIIKRGQIFA